MIVQMPHLQLRNGVYHYRRRVPGELQQAIGKREITRSLGTADQTAALLKAAKIDQEVSRLFERKRATTIPQTELEAHRLATEWIVEQGYQPGLSSDENSELARLEQAHEIIDRYQGKNIESEVGPEDMTLADRARVRALLGDQEGPALTLKDALALYLSEQEATPKRTENEAKRFREERERMIAELTKLVGNKLLTELRRSDAQAYRKALLDRQLAPGTVRKYLKAISTIISTAIREGEVKGAENPFVKLAVHDPVAAQDKRESFTKAELQTIVDALVATPPRDDIAALIRLALDTGARVGELAGLVGDDIVLTGEVPYLHIRANAVRGLKTASSRRVVPLVGEALVAAQTLAIGAKAGLPVFPAYSGDRGNTSASAAVNKWLSGTISSGKTAHSFRHTFKDRMRDALIPEDVRDVLQGHANPKVSAVYGQGHSIKTLAELMAEIRGYVPTPPVE